MLPRTTRGGFIFRRYFHHTNLLLAKKKPSSAQLSSLPSVTKANKKPVDANSTATQPIPISLSAQAIADEALGVFFRSRLPPSTAGGKGKATNIRQFGTLAFQPHPLLSANKKEHSESKDDSPTRPDIEEKASQQAKEQETRKQSEKQKRDDATDKAEENPKDESEVSWV